MVLGVDAYNLSFVGRDTLPYSSLIVPMMRSESCFLSALQMHIYINDNMNIKLAYITPRHVIHRLLRLWIIHLLFLGNVLKKMRKLRNLPTERGSRYVLRSWHQTNPNPLHSKWTAQVVILLGKWKPFCQLVLGIKMSYYHAIYYKIHSTAIHRSLRLRIIQILA